MRAAGGAAGATLAGGATAVCGPAGFGGAAGVTMRGGALAGALGAEDFIAGAAGLVSGAVGGAGRWDGALGAGAVPCCFARIAFNTSPGLEM
jgi:hypothetical protein